jgi:[protein-PII] uridylyltransferase
LHSERLNYEVAFAGSTTSEELAGTLVGCRDVLAVQADGAGGMNTMMAYSDLTDAFVRRVFSLAVSECESEHASTHATLGLAVAAVGGYGRREMSPFSDVDVAFIVETGEDDELDTIVKRAFRLLMDAIELTNLKVGYSYRKVDDVENLPLDTQTAMLDARRITGSQSVFNSFETALRRAIVPAAFVIGHTTGRRSSGVSTTPLVVEPDVKEGCGGLRDIHAARWIAQVTFGLGPDEVWEGLRARGIVTDADIKGVWEALEFIARTRNHLHWIAGRGQDILTIEKQKAVAERLGMPFDERPISSRFISVYYKHAKHLRQIMHKVSETCLAEWLEIEPGVVARHGRLYIRDRGLPVRDDAFLIRVFRHAQSYGLSIDPQAVEIISEAASRFHLTPIGGYAFLDIISKVGAASATRAMADSGVLQAVIPGFADLMVLVPGDIAHKFTVGEHCLRCVEELERLFGDENDLLGDVFSRIQNLEILFVAALMHDVGKLDSARDHSKTGASRANKLARSLGMDEESCRKVEFLVRHHLRMNETARMRDLNQRKTVRDFVAVVRDVGLLDMLLLLTIADSRAVGLRSWTQVQLRFLMELHERALAALRSPDSSADVERHRKRVRRELSLSNLPPEEVDEHCDLMPASYLLNTSPEELAAHIGFVRALKTGSPSMDFKDERGREYTEVTVFAYDKPGLLSDIAGVLWSMNVNIHAAQIYTRAGRQELAIDKLFVDFEGRQLTETKKWQVEDGLLSVLTGTQSVDQLLARLGKKAGIGLEGVSVKVLDNLSEHQTVLEVRALDTPGLLHYLTRALSELGFDIHSARVVTWGHEARDVFYLTTHDGQMLSDEQVDAIRTRLSDADQSVG